MNFINITSLRVNYKLALGFGLLLFFSLALVAIGFHSLESGGNSLSRINRLGSLFDQIVFLRESNYDFAINASSDSIDEHKLHIKEIQESLDQLLIDTKSGKWPKSDNLKFIDINNTFNGYVKTRENSHSREDVLRTNLLLSSFLEKVNEIYNAEEARAQNSVSTSQLALVSICLISLIVGISSSFYIGRQIVLPIKQSVETANNISSGNLVEFEVNDEERKDELGELLFGLSCMRQSLKDVLMQVSEVAERVSASSTQLACVTDENKAGILNQCNEIRLVSEAMQRMMGSVQEVAEFSNKVSDAAHIANEEANNAINLSENAINEIEKLSSEIESSALSIEHMQNEASKVGNILDVIKDVADQTNLLALNAAIEAARAGEAGKGFSVVADEVRNLAQRTQKSSSEIESLLVELQRIAILSSQSMKSNVVQSKESVLRVKETGNNLLSISKRIATITSVSESIEVSAVEQWRVADEINDRLVLVNNEADKLTKSSEDTSSASLELGTLVSTLRTLLKRFNFNTSVRNDYE